MLSAGPSCARRLFLSCRVARWVGALAFLGAGSVLALELPIPESWDTQVIREPEPQHVAIDGSILMTSLGSGSANLNGTFAPFGDITASGFRLRATTNESWYRFSTGTTPDSFASGNTVEVGLQAGYQVALERVGFLGLVGPTYARSTGNGVNTDRVGGKADLSMYLLPTDLTMVYGSVTYSTIDDAVEAQTKLGINLVGNVYIGPEAAFSWRNVRDVTPSFNNVGELRVGGHISAIALGQMQAGLSAGWTHQDQVGSGYYGGLNFYWKF
jgi:cellulose biosynthesis protein BcsS